jgi:hypothetical protein
MTAIEHDEALPANRALGRFIMRRDIANCLQCLAHWRSIGIKEIKPVQAVQRIKSICSLQIIKPVKRVHVVKSIKLIKDISTHPLW